MRHQLLSLPLVLVGAAAALGACTEPRAALSRPAAAPALEALIDWSDSLPAAGSTETAVVRLRGTEAAGVASFTGRITYDSTALRFVDEVPITDEATRVSNPRPGLVRVAGVSSKGFGGGQLYAARFRVLRPSALASVQLTFDEMHTSSRAEATVVVAGARMLR